MSKNDESGACPTEPQSGMGAGRATAPCCDSPVVTVPETLSSNAFLWHQMYLVKSSLKQSPVSAFLHFSCRSLKVKALLDVKALTTCSIYLTVQRQQSHHILPGSAGKEHILSTRKASFPISEKTACLIIRNSWPDFSELSCLA